MDDRSSDRRGHYLGLILPSGLDLVGLSRLVGLVVLLVLAYQQVPRMTPDQVTYLLLGLSAGLGLRGGGDGSSSFVAHRAALLHDSRVSAPGGREQSSGDRLGAAPGASTSVGAHPPDPSGPDPPV